MPSEVDERQTYVLCYVATVTVETGSGCVVFQEPASTRRQTDTRKHNVIHTKTHGRKVDGIA